MDCWSKSVNLLHFHRVLPIIRIGCGQISRTNFMELTKQNVRAIINRYQLKLQLSLREK